MRRLWRNRAFSDVSARRAGSELHTGDIPHCRNRRECSDSFLHKRIGTSVRHGGNSVLEGPHDHVATGTEKKQQFLGLPGCFYGMGS